MKQRTTAESGRIPELLKSELTYLYLFTYQGKQTTENYRKSR